MTFLLTDIVGSTQLWEQHPAAMATAMVVHDGVIDEVVARYRGAVVRPRGEGDSRFAVFGRTSDAAAAAVGVVAGLRDVAWPTPEPVRVRVGLHTGEAETRDGDYYGTAVNLCARLRGLAHPDQVLLSETTARLVRATPPVGVTVLEVGVHRLKGLSSPERVFQLCHDDLEDDFPALVSEGHEQLRPAFRSPKRTLVGRSNLIETVITAFGVARLVCLVGPAGVGKTSIADEVAARRVDAYRDGGCFVDLSLIREGGLVTAMVGTALGMRPGEAGIEIADVVDVLAQRELLLYIDNCEHLIDDAANLVDAVLRACPGVQILATSREPLNLVDEVVVTVRPLSDDDAIELFTIRARAADPSFNPDVSDRDALIQICQKVDGLPLGIELVSARVRALTPAEILDQLNVLRVERRGATARHHSLDAAVGWSYELLSPSRQRVLRRLSVFQGGATIAAAMRVCAEGIDGVVEGQPVVDELDALVARSLVVADRTPRGVRFRLLGTVSAFAGARLQAAGEAGAVGARLVEWMLEWAASTRQRLEGPDPAPAFADLAREEPNIRAAYAVCRETGDDRSLVRLVGAFGPFGLGSSGVTAEVDEWIERALAVEGTPPADRLQLLLLASWLAVGSVDVMAARTEEAVHLAEDLGDVAAQMFALGQLSDQLLAAEREMPLREQLEQAVALAPRANHPVYLASVLSTLANVLLRRGAIDDVRRLLEGFFAGGTAQFGLLEANVLYQAARAELMAGDLDRAEAGFVAAEDAAIRTASPIGLAFAVFGKGRLALARGDLVEARRWHEQNLEMMRLAAPRGALLGHYMLAVLCAAQGDREALAVHAAALEDARAQRAEGARHREGRYFPYADVASGLVALADDRVADAERLFLAAIDTRGTISLADAVDGLAACATARGDEARASVLAALAAGIRDGSRSVESVAGVIA